MYGPSSRNEELPSTISGSLYVFPSMNFSCDGTITDIRMRMDFIEGLQGGQTQIVWVYFLLFHDELTTPNRSVTQILLNTVQYNDSSAQRLTEVYQTLNLSLPVTEGDFIGFAVPPNDTVLFSKSINLSPTSEHVATHIHHLSATFSQFEVRVLEAARTADSSRFTTQRIAPPLIDVTFSKCSSLQHTLCTQNALTTTTASICTWFTSLSTSPLPPQALTAAQTDSLSHITQHPHTLTVHAHSWLSPVTADDHCDSSGSNHSAATAGGGGRGAGGCHGNSSMQEAEQEVRMPTPTEV